MINQFLENHHKFYENKSLYASVEATRFFLQPFHNLIEYGMRAYESDKNPLRNTDFGHAISANYEMWHRLTKRYDRPQFNIRSVKIKDKEYDVYDEVLLKKPFCSLTHFAKCDYNIPQKKLLIVAPLSGHYPTLLRGTVRDILPYFDVYITEWENARDVPITDGKFDLDDYIDYVIEFIEEIGEDVCVLAVCQPTVPVLAAVSIMASDPKSIKPSSLILTGGPVDARISPTDVDDFASKRQMNWFEEHMITTVPANYPGFMRSVYPGFIQLMGFMAMNLQRHVGEHIKLYQHLIIGDEDGADAKRKFYDEYLAVMDMPAEFYLQTLQLVFKDFALPRGIMYSRNRHVNTKAIKDTALLVIEGEMDDISGIGQTRAALNICPNVPLNMKKYHLQKGVGHYGVFNGSKYRNEIVPVIDEFTSRFVKLNDGKIQNRKKL